MYGNDSTGQSSANSNDNKSMMVLFGAAFLTGAAYYAPRFFCPPISEQEKEKKRKFADIAKLGKEQSLVELNEINEIRTALNQLYLDEKTCLAEAKNLEHELFREVGELVETHPASVNIDINSLEYKKSLLNELLETYPRLPKNVAYTYELVKDFCDERAVHHRQAVELAKVVLAQGYERINECYAKNNDVNSNFFQVTS